MNKCKINYSLVIALVLLVPCLAFALPGAHDPASGNAYTCNSCHAAPSTYGETDAKYATNVCLRCHSPSGDGKTAKKFAPEDYSNPFGTTSLTRSTALQTSHKWFGSDVVPAAGAVAPVDAASMGMNKNASFKNTLFCARCHNVHGTSGAQSNNSPYLRFPNDSDQLCLNCHRPRDTKDHALGTHPVNVSYTSASVKAKIAAGDFLSSPISNALNPTGQVKLVNSKVVCSTCHKVHNSDSRTSTFDPYSTTQVFGQLSSSKGYLLRVNPRGNTANDLNICTNCHANKFAHNGNSQNIQCNDCHGAHVEYDKNNPAELKNVYLIRRFNTYSAASGGFDNKRVLFRYTSASKREYYNAGKTGVCQGCHNPSATHFVSNNESNGLLSTRVACATCHKHNDPVGSFKASGCDGCHGFPPPTAAAGYTAYDESLTPHASHAAGGGSNYSFDCNQCHKGNDHNSTTPSFTDVFNSPAGTLAGSSAAYASSNCSTVYCHSDGNGTYKPIAWNSPKFIGQAGECIKCHENTAIVTGSHAKHVSAMSYGCATCHASTVSDNTTLLPAAKTASGTHVNAVKNVQFSGAGAASGSNCSTVACHGSGAPVWGAPLTGACGTCHATSTAGTFSTTSHATHFAVIGTGNSSCTTCHVGFTETGANHVNGSINVDAPNACSACHSDPYSGSTPTPPTWGSSSTGCNACHSSYPIAASGPATGSHAKHGEADCSKCHTGATNNTTIPSANHGNSAIDVANGYPATAKHAANTGYTGTCSTATCHADVYSLSGTVPTPVWGDTTKGCLACHTVAITATGPATGSHAKHGETDCSKCHATASSNLVAPTANHATGSINVTNGYPVTAKHAANTGYTGTCNAASCHDNGKGSPATTPVWGAPAIPACTACHALVPGDSHTKHVTTTTYKKALCADCHTGYVQGATAAANHLNNTVEVNTGGYPSPKAKGIAFASCATSYCHSSGQSADGTNATPVYATTAPAWGGTAGCGSCHATSAIDTGSHAKHLASYSCGACHTGATASAYNSTVHVDGLINVSVGTYTKAGAPGNGYGTCSTASCHDNPYSSGKVITPAWGVNTAAGCAGCHTGVGTITAIGPVTGSHAIHNSTTCANCHASGTTATVAPNDGTHADGSINVTNGYPITAKHTANTGYSGTCSTSSCHGSTSPVWGANTGNDLCTKCHGTGTVTVTPANKHVAAPTDAAATDTGKVSSLAKVGAHQTHLQLFNGLSEQGTNAETRCVVCHNIPSTGTHANGSSTPAFQGLATKSGTYSTTYNAGSCSVYCHNPAAATGGTLNSANNGTGTNPLWTNAAYVADGTLKTDSNCNTCHKSPGNVAFVSTFNHGFGITNDCAGCHSHNGAAGGSAGQQHMDGIKSGNGSCDACHGYPPMSASAFSARTGGEFVNAQVEDYAGGAGYHSTHLLASVTIAEGFTPCMPCHPSAFHMQGGGTVARANVNVNDAADTGYRFDSTRSKRYNTATLSCSNVSCHFQPTAPWSP